MADNYEIYGAEIVKETDDAFLVRADEFDHDVWIPRSVVDRRDSEINEEGQHGLLVVYGRWARREGWL